MAPLAAPPPPPLLLPSLEKYFESLSAEAVEMQEKAAELFAAGSAREGSAMQAQLDGRRALVAAFVAWGRVYAADVNSNAWILFYGGFRAAISRISVDIHTQRA